MEEKQNKKKITSEILTVMFVDLVGYTKTTGKLNRENISEMHDKFDEIVKPTFQKHNGKILKKMGDAFIVTFKSPTNALLCGIELQNSFEKFNTENQLPYPFRIRVALHTGEVLMKEGDIYGEAVNITARLENLAKPGEIMFSEALYLAMNKNEVPYVHLGRKRLKGIRHPVRLFRVKGYYDRIMQERRKKRRRKSLVRKILLVAFILLLAAALGVYAFFYLL